MPLESIKKRILAEAEAKAEEIKKQGADEAKRITAEAETRAKQIEREAQDEANSETRRLVKENDAGLEIESNAILLDAKGSAIEKAMQAVNKEIRELLAEKHLKQMLTSGIEQFRSLSPNEEIVVRTSKENSKAVGSLGSDVAVEYDKTEGFVIASKDGKTRLEVTPDSMIESNADEIRKVISDMLFGGGKRELVEEEML